MAQPSLEAKNPELESWSGQAANAPTLPETLVFLHRAHRPDPYHPRLQRLTLQALWRILQEEPFLAYKEETDHRYYVWNGLDLTLSVPKNRTPAEPYPPPEPSPLAPAWRALGWAMLGLSLAGIGALVFAPVALLRAMGILLNTQPLNRADRVRAAVAMILSLLLWALGAALGLLLLMHFLL